MMTKKIFAVGFKNWVELRSCSHPPVEEVTKAVRQIEVDDYDFNFYPPKKGKKIKKITIKVVHHEGGEVIMCVKSYKFYRVTGMNCGNGKMMEVGKEAFRKLVETKGE